MRHILGISGGKDSAALAVLLHKEVPEMEYVFCDTQKELPETYEFLERLEARLGIKIKKLSAERGFDHWLDIYGGMLPSPQVRWCTRQLKLIPLEQYIGDDEAISYVAIRDDEPSRQGYKSTKPNIKVVFPFRERGVDKDGVIKILEDSGIGMPAYYSWRTRSGCTFCFFQRKYEWVMLAEKHPTAFQEAVEYEKEFSDGRRYTWSQGETLPELLARKDEIIADHKRLMEQEKKVSPNRPLVQILAEVLDWENEQQGCVVCHV
ncbi:MAG: phosphoadenosine phosphosulfate reductase family protein [Acidobacteriota bacterium]|nr:phosphoadenosine phosphosulfate reductase family protein [Acidobacteriota bacterium]